MTFEYIVEYAPTPRSTCTTCLSPISLSALRIGCLETHRPHWRHWSCATPRVFSRVEESGGEFKSSMQWLKERDYMMVDQDLKRGWILGKEEGASRKRIRRWERDDAADTKWKIMEVKMGRGRAEWKDLGEDVKKTELVEKKGNKEPGRVFRRTTRNSMRAGLLV